MVSIERLRSLFTSELRQEGDSYVLEVPAHEVDNDALNAGEHYRVAVVDAAEPVSEDAGRERDAVDRDESQPTPPVEEGEVRRVSVETTGDQGDGIAKVERGYVVIVPDARPGDRPTVEVEEVKQNVAFARVVDENRST